MKAHFILSLVLSLLVTVLSSCKSPEQLMRETLNGEAQAEAFKVWDVVASCGDSYYEAVNGDDGSRNYVEFKTFLPMAVQDSSSVDLHLGEAERLNRNENKRLAEEKQGKIDWEGEIRLVARTWRVYSDSRGWSSWSDGNPYVDLSPIILRKVNGKWIYGSSPKFENPVAHIQKKFAKPSCSEVPIGTRP